MKKCKIVGIETMFMPDAPIRFQGFRLQNVIGSVDPFVNGRYMPPELLEYLDDKGDAIKDGFVEAEMEWAKKQIGKYLHCEDLIYRAFATYGDVSIEEKPE